MSDPRRTAGRSGIGRRLFSESAVYGVGGIANQALTILLVPVYARVLGEAGVGVVALLTATLSLAQLVATLALPQAFFRAYLGDARGDDDRRDALAAFVGLRTVASLGFAALLGLAALPLTALLFGDAGDPRLLLLVAITVLFDSLTLVPLSFLRAERRAGAYATLSFGRAVLGTLLAIWFVVVVGAGPLGVVLGSALGAAVGFVVGLVVYVRRAGIGPRWDGPRVRSMLGFSLPLVPAAIAGWGLNLADRYVLGAVRGHEELGVYAIGYTGGLVINALAIAPFTLAWGATYWDIGRRDDAPLAFRRILHLHAVVTGGLAVLLSAVGTDAIRILLTPGFDDARYIVPFSAFGMVLYGMYGILATGLHLTSHTRWLPLTMGGAALVNLVLNVLLVPGLGMVGAGAATLAGYATLAASTGAIAHRHYPVPWDVPRLVAVLALAGAIAAASLLGPDAVLWRLACVTAYPIAVVGLRLVSTEDVGRLATAVSRRLGRR